MAASSSSFSNRVGSFFKHPPWKAPDWNVPNGGKQRLLEKIAFFMAGCASNLSYVVILSAAADIVDPSTPKGIVLVADILPSLLVKLIAPHLVFNMPYGLRAFICTALSFTAMQLIAWSTSLSTTLAGIVMASASSGFGEMSWLMLTSYYPALTVSAWSSGTGGAGILGAVLYLALTTWIGLSIHWSLVIFSFLPTGMLWAYFGILRPSKARLSKDPSGRTSVSSDGHSDPDSLKQHHHRHTGPIDPREEEEGLEQGSTFNASLSHRLSFIRTLILPYMLPLFLVYWAEYSINQGVSPALLYPLHNTPFTRLRDLYVYYQTLYQLGVFISRSSVSFFPIRRIWIPSLLQVITLFLLTSEAMWSWIGSVWPIFILILWEGLLGGATYVNCYFLVRNNVVPEWREFALGVVGMSDGLGITAAGLTGVWLESALCNWRSDHSMDPLCLSSVG
ncbi:MAG: batten's disease protein Cln3 [Piptocephalis tieghemiana]|nr:MAG: batten's disease protein Cln3 [Piptocephalis tieghemiana]